MYCVDSGAYVDDVDATLEQFRGGGEAAVQVEVTERFREAFPGARVGLLAIENVENPTHHAGLEQHVAQVELRLRERYRGQHRPELLGLPTMQAYLRHYRQFGQNYHVLRQLESVALKNRPLSSPSALVLAMFAAELESLLLTAAHDLDAVAPPIEVDATRAEERFGGIGGQELVMRAADMCMRDAHGVISAVVYGPDQRTRLSEATRRVLFTTYVPAEIEDALVRTHLARVAELVGVLAPDAQPGSVEIFG